MDIKNFQLVMKEGNPKERYEAVSTLVKSRHPDAIRLLSDILDDETHAKVRERIQQGITFLGNHPTEQENVNPSSVDKEISASTLAKVRSALDSEEESQFLKALKFIQKNDCTVLIPHAIELCLTKNNTDYSIQLLQSIGKMKRSEFSSELIDFMKSSNTSVVSAAVDAQYQIGCLSDYLSFLKDYSSSTNEELLRIGDDYLQLLITSGNNDAHNVYQEILNKREQKAKEEAYQPYIPEGMEDLLPQNVKDANRQKELKNNEKKKKAVLTYKFKSQLESEDPKLRIEAITQLASSGDPEAIELITQLISNETDIKVVATGISSLGRIGSEAAISSLQNFLSHEDNRVRANTVDAINTILGIEKPKPMLEALLKDPCHRVRANTISALLSTKPKECFLPLHSLVNSSSADENIAAILIIEKFQFDTHLTMLEKFTHSTEPKVVERTKNVLSNWQGDKVLSNYILSEGENFQDFYTQHIEKKKLESARQDDPNSKSESLTEEKTSSEVIDEQTDKPNEPTKSGFLANFLNKFRS